MHADGVDAFNAAPGDQFAAQLQACLAVPRWVAALLAGRPYPDRTALLDGAKSLAAGLDDVEVVAALGGHPRIGERATGGAAEARFSGAEQSGVDPADADVRAALREGNAAYEARFGQLFLVRAAGRSSAQILALLRERLRNDPETERDVVRDQLGEIAALRLSALLDRLEQEAG